MPVKGSVLRGGAAAMALCVLAALPALAQTAAPYPYPACGGRSPTTEDVAAAKKTFELANRYLSEADYERAIAYYRDAYRSDCTAHKLLGYIARAYELRGDRAEAVRALEAYLERAPHGDDRAVVAKRIANLRAQIVLAPRVAGADAGRDGGDLDDRDAAATSAVATADAGVEGATVYRGVFAPTAPFVVAGAGVAAMLAGGIVSVAGGGDIAQVERACGGRVCGTPDEVARGNAARGMQNAGNVVLGVGAACVVGGAVWWLLTRGAEAPSKAAVAASPVIGPSFSGVAVDGRF